MSKYFVRCCAFACLVAISTPVQGGEEIMALHPGPYAEVGSEPPYQVTRSVSNRQVILPPIVPRTHVNQVRLKLPSLGPRMESRLQLVEVGAAGKDGALDFSRTAPAQIDVPAGIPGLVSPELLALDQYNQRVPDKKSPAIVEPLAKPDGPSATESAAARENEPAMRRLDSINNPKRRRTAFTRVEIRSGGDSESSVPVIKLTAPSTPKEIPPSTERRKAAANASVPPVEVWSLDPAESHF